MLLHSQQQARSPGARREEDQAVVQAGQASAACAAPAEHIPEAAGPGPPLDSTPRCGLLGWVMPM